MKTILAVAALVLMGCGASREINVEIVSAQLIRVDTIYRNTGDPKQQLIWRDRDNIEYISIVGMNRNYPVGVTLNMLRPR